MKLYVRDLDNPSYLNLSLAARGFLSDFQRLAASMDNRVPEDATFIARKLAAPPHVVGKMIATCVKHGFLSRFAEDLNTSKDNDLYHTTDTRPIPPSLSNSVSHVKTTPNKKEDSSDGSLFTNIDELDIPF